MSGIKRFSNDHPLFFVLICIVLFMLTFYGSHVILAEVGCYDGVAHECFVAIFFAALAAAVVGPIRFSREGVEYTLRKSMYFILLTGGLLAFCMYILLVTGTFPVEKGWFFRVLYFGIYLLAVGVFEEFLNRVLITGALVRKFGNTSKGFMCAVTAASFFFGLMHVFPDIVTGNIKDLSTILQALFKTADVTIVGLLMTALYYRTHNIWGCVLAHVLADLAGFMYIALTDLPMINSYIRTDDNPGGNSMSLVIYPFILFLFYLPILRTALRELSMVKTPEYGPFVGGWEPRDPLSNLEYEAEEMPVIFESESELVMISKDSEQEELSEKILPLWLTNY